MKFFKQITKISQQFSQSIILMLHLSIINKQNCMKIRSGKVLDTYQQTNLQQKCQSMKMKRYDEDLKDGEQIYQEYKKIKKQKDMLDDLLLSCSRSQQALSKVKSIRSQNSDAQFSYKSESSISYGYKPQYRRGKYQKKINPNSITYKQCPNFLLFLNTHIKKMVKKSPEWDQFISKKGTKASFSDLVKSLSHKAELIQILESEKFQKIIQGHRKERLSKDYQKCLNIFLRNLKQNDKIDYLHY